MEQVRAQESRIYFFEQVPCIPCMGNMGCLKEPKAIVARFEHLPVDQGPSRAGRNDIVEAKVSFDDQNVYFYVRTREPLSPPSGPWARRSPNSTRWSSPQASRMRAALVAMRVW